REGAQRKEDRSRQASQNRDQKCERKDQALRDQEDLAVEEERPRDLRERCLEVMPAEESLVNRGPARRVGDDHDDDDDEDKRREHRDRHRAAAVSSRQGTEDARAPRLVYFKIGAPVAFASHVCWSCCSVPFERRVASALSTHVASESPFAKTMPK